MGSPVEFVPASIGFGVTAWGYRPYQTTTSALLSAPVNVTASLVDDDSGGAFSFVLRSFVDVEETEFPEAGEGPRGGNLKPAKVVVAQQMGQYNPFQGPLPVQSGQYIFVTVQFAPSPTTPTACGATLQISGDSWSSPSSYVDIPITATVGQVTVLVHAPLQSGAYTIQVARGAALAPSVGVTVQLAQGPPTTVSLSLNQGGTPDVNLVPKSPTFTLKEVGQTASCSISVSSSPTDTIGDHSWTLSMAAFEGAVAASCPLSVQVITPPAPAPAAGLQSNSNYVLYSPTDLVFPQPATTGNGNNLVGASVTIDVTEDIVLVTDLLGSKAVSESNKGFGFQFNTWSLKNPSLSWDKAQGWQQWGVNLDYSCGELCLNAWVDDWPPSPDRGQKQWQNSIVSLMSPWPDLTLPKKYQLKISLVDDKDGNILGAKFVVTDDKGVQHPAEIDYPPGVPVAPIVAMALNIVGPDNSEQAVLSSGAGTITYEASNLLTPSNQQPANCVYPNVDASDTGETANVVYGQLLGVPGKKFTQTFYVALSGASSPTPIRPPRKV